MRAKVMALRADPERCSHPLAAAARDAIHAAVESLTDRDARKDALTRAVRRRVEEMRRDGVGDVAGGYVSSTGVHYAAGAAASETANYKPDGDAHGPTTNPAAGNKQPPGSRNAPSVADGADVGAGTGARLGLDFGSGDADGPGARPAAKDAAKEAANGSAGDAALEARLKLAKRRGPTFM